MRPIAALFDVLNHSKTLFHEPEALSWGDQKPFSETLHMFGLL